MSTSRAASNNHDRRQEPSLSTTPGTSVPGKHSRTKRPPAGKNPEPLPTKLEQESLIPPANGDVRARIAARAYELYNRRRGQHGQDLNDWFAAEQEIRKEDVK